MIGLGTLVNCGAVIVGSCVGMLIHSRLPEKMISIVFQGIGLFTLVIGISMSLSAENMILVLLSIAAGAVVGQVIDIDKQLRRFLEYVRRKTEKKNAETSATQTKFTEGFVTASMLYCIGSMSILGAIEDGMGEAPQLLFTKSVMDGISSVALASTFGMAILLSSIPLLVYQGAITIFAGFIMQYMTDPMIADLTATGGILLIGLGINILNIKSIQVTNMLPAIIIVVILSGFYTTP